MSDCYLPVNTGSDLNYSFDWTGWLADGDSISTRQWTIDPAGPTLTDDTTATVTVDGFTTGVVYRLKEDIVTVDGLSERQTIVLRTE